jgi:hypothetical protein
MSKLIKLPSGATVTLRDPATLKQKDRMKVYRNADASETVTNGMALLDNFIAVMVEEWSFDLLPPSVKPESLGELSIVDYDTLRIEVEKSLPALFPSLSKNAENVDDPKVLTAD